MKKNTGTTLFVIGMTFGTIAIVVTDYNTLRYIVMILGLLVMIYSVFVADKWRKSQIKKEN